MVSSGRCQATRGQSTRSTYCRTRPSSIRSQHSSHGIGTPVGLSSNGSGRGDVHDHARQVRRLLHRGQPLNPAQVRRAPGHDVPVGPVLRGDPLDGVVAVQAPRCATARSCPRSRRGRGRPGPRSCSRAPRTRRRAPGARRCSCCRACGTAPWSAARPARRARRRRPARCRPASAPGRSSRSSSALRPPASAHDDGMLTWLLTAIWVSEIELVATSITYRVTVRRGDHDVAAPDVRHPGHDLGHHGLVQARPAGAALAGRR